MTTRPLLKQGSQGEHVTYLWERLKARGYDPGSLSAWEETNGAVFGGNIDRAVEQFQAAHGLGVDGIVGANTWAALDAASGQETKRGASALSSDSTRLYQRTAKATKDKLRRLVVETALLYLDACEVPSGSNDGPDLRPFLRPDGVSYYDALQVDRTAYPNEPPWCVLFAVGMWRLALATKSWSATPFVSWHGSTGYLAEWARAAGCYHDADSDYIPLPGDLLVMDRNKSGSDVSKSTKAGHTGIVAYVADDGAIVSIDGNVSDKVDDRSRDRAIIGGFIDVRSLLP